MQKINIRLVALLLIIFALTAIGYGQQIEIVQNWSDAASAQLKTLIDPDLNLPRPAIQASLVREFTRGNSNTIYWNVNETVEAINNPQVTVKFYEIKAEYTKDGEDFLLWGVVTCPVNSATFTNLPEYVKISYYIRYFVQDEGQSDFRMSRWSEPVSSTQDYNPPYLDLTLSGITNLNDLGNQNWIVGKNISLHITASDLPIGKLELIKIQEAGQREVSYPILPPRTAIDTVITYTLKVKQKTPVVLSYHVTDVSLQSSEISTVTLIWLPEEEGLGELICFPNPFNPESDINSKIKVGIPGVTDARIFDAFGNLVVELSKEKDADFFTWDGRNGRGDIVSSGGYLCVLAKNRKKYCKIAVYR